MLLIREYDPPFIKKRFLSLIKRKAVLLNVALVLLFIPFKGHTIIYISFAIFSIHI